jgi:hypothetical protein
MFSQPLLGPEQVIPTHPSFESPGATGPLPGAELALHPGSNNGNAAAYSPFCMRLNRNDGGPSSAQPAAGNGRQPAGVSPMVGSRCGGKGIGAAFRRIGSVRGGSKTLIAIVAALLLALGIAACGGSDSSTGSTATPAGAQDQTGKSGGRGSSGETSNSRDGESNAAGSEGESSAASSGGSEDFVPKQHHDSGGGSEQFKVKGGDNSVQEFGAEADTSERDEAAAALHNFLDARAAGDWAAACSYMSKSATESLEKFSSQIKQANATGCAGVFEKLTNPAARGEMRAEAAKADVGSLRIEDEHAFLIYRGVGGTVLAMPMANEGGSWKVASLAGTPLN